MDVTPDAFFVQGICARNPRDKDGRYGGKIINPRKKEVKSKYEKKKQTHIFKTFMFLFCGLFSAPRFRSM